MIVYGTKYSTLGTHRIPGPCPNCGAEGTVTLTILQRYAHFFWIPFFPAGRTGGTVCNNCKQQLEPKNMPPATRQLYDDLKKQGRAPIWMFAGLAVVAVLIPLVMWRSDRHDKQLATWLAAPQVGDVYTIDLPGGGYTLYKVAAVRNDSVMVLMHDYETDRLKGLSSLRSKGDAGYGDEVLGLSFADVQRMRGSGEIHDVDR